VPTGTKLCILSILLLIAANAHAQTAPNLFEVLMYSGTTTTTVGNTVVPNATASIFSETKTPVVLGSSTFVNTITNAANYGVAQSIVQIGNAINGSIATALSILPLASPASGVILKKDPATGAELPVSSTLGTIYTERAETIGKHRFFIGFTHQNFHFTSLNGESLNGISVLYPGGDASGILTGSNQPIKTYPATFNLGLDVRLSQDVAFLTYGVTNRFDVSLGLPVVHAAVAATTYNGTIYAGDGLAGQDNMNCWCVNTFQPGSAQLTAPMIGASSLGKTGFGDLLLRFKGTVLERPGAVIALGTDLRFPTGDEQNYLGTGATSVKPFVAISLYTKPFSNGIVLAPHLNVGWQFIGKSVLGGQLQGTEQTINTSTGPISYIGAPFTSSKDYLPDVFSWAVGTEVAFGRRNTAVIDILGNQIGWVNGIPNTIEQSVQGFSPIPNYPQVQATGIVSGGRTSIGEYSGAFGYKVRVVGNLVATFDALVRFNDAGLTARFVPLYGLGYSF
jgi:hypothetical protein